MINIAELKEELQQAEQNFNYADPRYVDAAIYRLKAAEEKINAALKELKGTKMIRFTIKTKQDLLKELMR